MESMEPVTALILPILLGTEQWNKDLPDVSSFTCAHQAKKEDAEGGFKIQNTTSSIENVPSQN